MQPGSDVWFVVDSCPMLKAERDQAGTRKVRLKGRMAVRSEAGRCLNDKLVDAVGVAYSVNRAQRAPRCAEAWSDGIIDQNGQM